MTTTLKRTMLESTLIDNYDMIEPCYLFDKKVFVKNILMLKEAFERTGLNVKIGYSYKTNNSSCVIRAAKEVACIEVVSKCEFRNALLNGFDYKDIIYNGIIEDVDGKFNVAKYNGIVNIENEREFFQLEEYARNQNATIAVGLRLNISFNRISRFGVVKDSDEWLRIINLSKCSKHIRINGIHCHAYGSRDLESWKKKINLVATAAKEIGAEYIDFGSSMYGNMDERLKSQFRGSIPTFEDYACEVYSGLKSIYGNEKLPNIVIEPGTPVVANAVSILAKVTNIRDIQGKMMANTDCTIYDMGFMPFSKNVPVDVIHTGKEVLNTYEDIDIYGYTCTEGDVIHRGYSGQLAVGDYLLFRNLGAYSTSMSCSFISEPLKMYEVL